MSKELNDMMFKSGDYSPNNNNLLLNNIYTGVVVSVDDVTDALRIKVRVSKIDSSINNDSLPYCNSLLPKYLNIIPQEGEAVYVLIPNINNPFNNRLYIGSIISQWQHIEKAFYNNNALSATEYAKTGLERAITNVEQGVFPEKKDIALVGRKNTDIILRDNEVIIRAGKHENDNIFKLNKKNPSYQRLKFNIDTDTSYSIAVSDKNYLLSHKGNKLPNSILTDDDVNNLDNITEPIAYGNKLLNILKKMLIILETHAHPYHNSPILPEDPLKELFRDIQKEFETLLSENNRIN
jgi:hypothetical protein